MKKNVKKLIGQKYYGKISSILSQLRQNYIIKHVALIRNFIYDFRKFYTHSSAFSKDNFQKIESSIILKYHALEKGLLHNEIRYKFGRKNILKLRELLTREEVVLNKKRSQIMAGFTAMCRYYELHQKNNIDISDYFPESDYITFKGFSNEILTSVKKNKYSSYFANVQDNFFDFSFSRSSVRDFTGEKVHFKTIQKVIKLASNAPSVCNRQPVKIYYTDNKKIIDEAFEIQQGLNGFSNKIVQLLVVVSDRNYFYTVGERNQLYVDGGIYLMNLLYALHYYKIAACPANWGKQMGADKKLKKLLNMTNSEKVICLVPIGIPTNNFKTCRSLRREVDEILKIV